MNPPDYELQPSDIPQPKLLDEEISTTNWPMPPAKAWEPLPDDPEAEGDARPATRISQEEIMCAVFVSYAIGQSLHILAGVLVLAFAWWVLS